MIYFAYGSNLNPSQMADRCPGHRSLGVARLPGHRLVFPRFSPSRQCASAGYEPSPRDVLWGALYDVPEGDVPILNYQEGYDPEGPPDQNRHNLREVTVIRQGGEQVRAMTYAAVPDGTTALPSRAYLDTIIDGALYHGLPRTWLVVLRAVRTA